MISLSKNSTNQQFVGRLARARDKIHPAIRSKKSRTSVQLGVAIRALSRRWIHQDEVQLAIFGVLAITNGLMGSTR
jgi:hypothetical protein